MSCSRLALAGAIIFFSATLAPGGRAHAQEAGIAAIASPSQASTVAGLVPILGTATHPQFHHYEVAFGYNLDTTGTWFTIQDPTPAQVVNGALAQWDTTGITDGVYNLRLRVYWTERDYQEVFALGVRVQNNTPTAPPVPPTEAATFPPPATATPAPPQAMTQAIIALPASSTPRPTTASASLETGGGSGSAARFIPSGVWQAFLKGAQLTLAAFFLLGAYAGLKAVLRSRTHR